MGAPGGAPRDVIKAHRSLYLKGNILHRDISENNIIITDPKRTGVIGMLIDLDLAKELGSGRSCARCRTGMMEFMAIELLLGISHTYRYDIESFFCVTIWQCARHGWGDEWSKDTMITNWCTGSSANAKIGTMSARMGFERLLMNQFPLVFDCVRPLCRKLRGILLPFHEGDIFTGTPKDPESLHGPELRAFDKAIDLIKAIEGQGRVCYSYIL